MLTKLTHLTHLEYCSYKHNKKKRIIISAFIIVKRESLLIKRGKEEIMKKNSLGEIYQILLVIMP